MTAKMQSRILTLLWLAVAAVWFGGGKTVYLFRALLPITGLILWARPKTRDELFTWLRVKISTGHVMLFAGAVLFTQCVGLVLDYEGLNGTLWDLGQYLSTIRNFAVIHKPVFTFHGSATSNYFYTHSSLSIFVLGALYRVFGHPWIALLWQGVFLTAPAFVALLWHRAAARSQGYRPEPLGYLLAFLTYATTPVFLGQEFWPYIFHVAGLTALALAYLFYFEKRWRPWFVALVVLTLEKEDFGAIAATFGALVFAESLWSARLPGKRGLTRPQAEGLGLSALAMIGGVGFYIFYSSRFAHAVPFSGKFGHIAQTPAGLILAFFTKPLLVLKTLARPLSAKYLWFFVAASFLWLKPRWSALRFFVPIAPVMILNALAAEGTMQLFKDHYALPIAVGLSATLVLGVWDVGRGSRRKPDARLYAYFALTALFPLLWQHQSTFRHFREAFGLWRARAADRAVLASVKKDKSLIVCCEDRLCTWLIERPLALDYAACLRGSVQLENFVGRKAVFVVHTAAADPRSPERRPALPFVRAPNKWVAVTPFLRLSEPISVEK